jgi:hypothetical protein
VTAASFGAEQRALLERLREVEIETRAAPEAPLHRTIVWVVVDPGGRVLVRSYRGPGARWYREALAQPDCRLLVAGQALAVRVESAADQDRVTACSDGLARKYAGDPSLPPMLAHHLETTLQLLPR